MSGFHDPIADGLARGWRVLQFEPDRVAPPDRFECDVAIVGSGAGGGITAELLARHGLTVLIIEEGPLRSSRHFKMLESQAYPDLYQESAARKTSDKAINILQGRCVGGSTTVNWTSSFRTPEPTLSFWRERLDLRAADANAMAPWFEQVETRLGIADWPLAPNRNNELLRQGMTALGLPSAMIRRNVRGCLNLGYCGMGCPSNAKQSMLVTTLPAALDRGATLFTRARAWRLIVEDGMARGLQVHWLAPDGRSDSGHRTLVRARHLVLAGGAINTPALLLRSQVADPHRLIGARTFLHPTVISAAEFADPVDGFQGAPQTVYSDHFLAGPVDGPPGFKLEAPPLHPLLVATTLQGMGSEHASRMRAFRQTHALLALIRDGFHPQSEGGRVGLRGDGSPVLDYPLAPVLMDAARRALLSMAQIQFAAGARRVFPIHEQADGYRSWAQARQAIADLPMAPLALRVVSAHVMGGCAMAADERRGPVDEQGRLRALQGVSVHDGSLFPTSIGANPQLSIYAWAARLSVGLATRLTGRPALGFV